MSKCCSLLSSSLQAYHLPWIGLRDLLGAPFFGSSPPVSESDV